MTSYLLLVVAFQFLLHVDRSRFLQMKIVVCIRQDFVKLIVEFLNQMPQSGVET